MGMFEGGVPLIQSTRASEPQVYLLSSERFFLYTFYPSLFTFFDPAQTRGNPAKQQ
jgi:hypothetical protein